MATFLELQDDIEGYLLRTDINSYVKSAINDSIAKYSKSRFWFDETIGNFNTVQGTWFYDTTIIPDNIRQIDYFRITVNNVYYDVNQRDIQFIIDANVNNNQGQPTDWAWYNRSIAFYPVPQAAYPITLYYQKSYAPLIDASDSNDFTNILEAKDLIENETLSTLYRKVILDKEKADEYALSAASSLQVLNQITESITGINGYIKPTEW